MKNTRLFINPHSKNIVDAVIDHTNRTEINIGLTPTRQQIDWNQGYVNSWFTDEFISYVLNNSKYVTIGRAHGGTGQGNVLDNGLESLGDDCRYGSDLVHIDPWKRFPNYSDGISETVHAMQHCRLQNPRTLYEIGYHKDIVEMMQFIGNQPAEIYDNIEYVDIQRVEEIAIVHSYGKKAKLNKAGTNYTEKELTEFLRNGLDVIEASDNFHNVEMRVLEDDVSGRAKIEFKKLRKLADKNNDHVYNLPEWQEFKQNLNPDVADIIKIAIKTNIRYFEKLINENSIKVNV